MFYRVDVLLPCHHHIIYVSFRALLTSLYPGVTELEGVMDVVAVSALLTSLYPGVTELEGVMDVVAVSALLTSLYPGVTELEGDGRGGGVELS